MSVMVGIDPNSDGLARATRMGYVTTHEGVDGLIALPEFDDIEIVFDATSAGAHRANAEKLLPLGRTMIDLTPAAIGPYVVPVVNLEEHLDAQDVNMVTCGGQATIPMVAAISAVVPVLYGEIVASIASRSAGPGTRANIDEFTETTAAAIEAVGGAAQWARAVMILNPADPPILMRNTVYCLVDGETDHGAIERSIEAMVERVRAYVPGYKLKQRVQFETFTADSPLIIPETGKFVGTRVTAMLEVTGAADYLPAYAGNLDIMTSAAMRTAERMVLARKESAK